MTNEESEVRSRLAHQAHDGAVDSARDSQAADVGVAGGDTQRDPLYALGIGSGRRGGRCRERLGGGARTAAHLAGRLADREARAAGAHVDGLGGAQADCLGGAGGAEERDDRTQRVGGARERLDVLGVHAHVRAVVEVAARGEALCSRT